MKRVLNNSLFNSRIFKRFIILLIIVFLFANLYSSNAYYHNEVSAYIIKSRIAQRLDYDYTLLIYLENIQDSDYHLTSTIPVVGYSYSGYNCQNNSPLYYDDINKMTTVTTTVQEVCSVYFNLLTDFDINIVYMLEEEYNSNTYIETNIVPYYGYIYNSYECDNNSLLNYYSNLHYVELKTINKDYCKVYFKKQDTNIIVDLYINDNNNYILNNFIPVKKAYEINESNTVCYDESNNIVETNVTYENGYINISNIGIKKCNVYLDETT